MAQGPSDTILVAIWITLQIRESKVRNPDPPDRRRFVLSLSLCAFLFGMFLIDYSGMVTGKVKPIWIYCSKRVSGSGIIWAICKSAPWPRHITTPASHHSVFYRRMPFLPSSQQRQSTEGKSWSFINRYYPLWLLQVFLKSEAFIQLEEIRDNKVCNLMSHFQALSRGYLSRSRVTEQKVSELCYVCHTVSEILRFFSSVVLYCNFVRRKLLHVMQYEKILY